MSVTTSKYLKGFVVCLFSINSFLGHLIILQKVPILDKLVPQEIKMEIPLL